MMEYALPMAAYAGGLAATLVLACYLTPARWWRRPTLRNLGIAFLGAWGIGGLLLQALGSESANDAAPPATVAQATPVHPAPIGLAGDAIPAAPFRVHRALNLRERPGTGAGRLGTIPAGTLVAPTGARDGDWWQVRAHADGKALTGWASSLWLRRQAE